MYILFEDFKLNNFYPLSLTRHVSMLLAGSKTFHERTQILTKSKVGFLGRDYLKNLYLHLGINYTSTPEANSLNSDSILINSRLILNHELLKIIADEATDSNNFILKKDDNILACKLGSSLLQELVNLEFQFDKFEKIYSENQGLEIKVSNYDNARIVNYVWEILDLNNVVLNKDYSLFYNQNRLNIPAVIGDKVFLGSNVKIGSNVVLDSSNGAIIIEDNCNIMHNSVIVGPAFIGKNSVIKVGAKIYENCSIGEFCKIGGELENSVIIGFSNKQHDGFLGHSYLGEWVNLGADTNTSDLKNNYGEIKIIQNNRQVNTGRMFLGSLIADHSKTSINTMLNTGTIVGVCANIFGGEFPDKNIKSFSWGSNSEKYRFDAACELAEKVMNRRNINFSEHHKAILKFIFDNQF